MPTCLVVQHVVPESAWSVGTALERAGATLDVRRTFAGDGIPSDTEGLAGLVVMGGPMSAATDEGFPTRRDEVALLADAVARGLPTLGICLGAQLLAVSAGADVSAGAGGPEIGWAPVDFTSAAADDVLLHGLPDRLCVLHWHGDTFTLPAGGELLASNDRYERQAFRVGPVAWGLQFHMEVTAEAVEGFLAAFADEADQRAGRSGRRPRRHSSGAGGVDPVERPRVRAVRGPRGPPRRHHDGPLVTARFRLCFRSVNSDKSSCL